MNLRFLVFAVACTTAFGQRLVTPEEFLGGADNLRLIARAEVISVEKVSVPSRVTVTKWANGHPEFEENDLIIWQGGPLTVEKGPVPIPAALGKRIKDAIEQPWIDDGTRMGCGYLPIYRITLKEPQHTLLILVIRCYDSLEVYRDGVHLGGRLPGQNGRDLHEIVSELDTLLRTAEKEPNKAAEPTRTSVTPPAGAGDRASAARGSP